MGNGYVSIAVVLIVVVIIVVGGRNIAVVNVVIFGVLVVISTVRCSIDIPPVLVPRLV
jgi:hypothetical protein